jgi:2-methylcitrate dehydratase PrpD
MQTKLLSDFVQSIKFSSLPAEVVDMTKMCVEDIIGVAIAGSKRKEADIWKSQLTKGPPGAAKANLWMPGFETLDYVKAAEMNAALGHLIDMDDLHNASITHLGVVTIPAAIAVGQILHSSGKDVIAAIVAGYEAGARIGEAINPDSYWYWHTTGIVGSFCSGVAVGHLMNLSPEAMLNCFGSAGTQSAGVWQFLKDGAMSKSLHTVNATACGIRAAELSALGFTGAAEILEGDRGLVRAVAPKYNLDALTKKYAEPYRVMTNSFKPYACCRHTHSANYAVEKILAQRNLEPDDIVSIDDFTYKTAVQLTDKAEPVTPYACKFSLQYCIATAIVLRDLSETVFLQENTNNPVVRKLMKKIRVFVDEKLEAEFRENPNQWTHILKITLTSGEVVEMRVDYPLGDFNLPFDWDTADKKFMTLTNELISSKQQDRLIKNIHNLEQMKDINELFHWE